MSGQLADPLPEEPLSDELPDELPEELDDPEDEPDDDPEELDEAPEDEPDEEPLLESPDDEPDEPEDESDGVELDSSQQPSPSDSTSHLQLSAKCLANPYVPAGTLSAVQHAAPEDAGWQMSGQTTPTASWTVNVSGTGHHFPSL